MSNAQLFIMGFIERFLPVDMTIADIRNKWDLDHAEMIMLDHIGEMISLPRAGADDTEYRRRLKGWIALLSSTGSISSVKEALRTLLNADRVRIDNHGMGTFNAYVYGDYIDTWGVDFIQGVCAAGTRISEFYIVLNNAFRHDSLAHGHDLGEMI